MTMKRFIFAAAILAVIAFAVVLGYGAFTVGALPH